MTDKKNIWARSEQLLLLCGTNSPVCSAAEKNHKRSGPIVAKKTNTKASFLERKISSCSRIWWDPECSKHIRFLVERVP
jgi:hypothetical protein